MQIKILKSEFHPPTFPCECHGDTTHTALHRAFFIDSSLQMFSDQLRQGPRALWRGLQPHLWVDQSTQPGSYCWIPSLFTWGVLPSLRNPQMPRGRRHQQVNGDKRRLVQSHLSLLLEGDLSLSWGIFLGEGLLWFPQVSGMKTKRRHKNLRVGVQAHFPALCCLVTVPLDGSKPQILHLTNKWR